MAESTFAINSSLSSKSRLIVALDVDSKNEARSIISELGGEVGAFKIGLQLFTNSGPDFVREMVDSGSKIFLDLKFHDIPNTVAKAALEAARLGVWMFNVHASGGSEMMRRTVEEAANVSEKENLARPKIIAVTVLTSSGKTTLSETGVEREMTEQVLKLAELAAKCGLDGVVASPLEIVPIRNIFQNRRFLIVTPGIRPAFATNDDQRRVMTPGEAIATGSDYIVIGRPIIQAADRRKAVAKILEEIETA